MSLLSLLPILIILSGAYFLIKLKLFFLKHPIRTLKFAFSGKNKRKSFLSLMLALAGTLGVGNISGVAIGIAVGGAGSVFWLIVSALFSSAIKYAEVFISYRFGGVGMINVIKDSFNKFGISLSYVYALLTIVLSISMGSVFQARAVSEAAENTFSIDKRYLSIILTVLLLSICISGKDKIKKSVAVIIPIAMIVYTGMCLFVICANLHKLPSVFSRIISSAFSTKSVSGGVLGFISSTGMREGFARGLLSNEAGAGTSSFSHTSHLDLHPSNDECIRAGIFGILEVVFDTLLLCPLTAFAILVAFDDNTFSGSLTELSIIFESGVGIFSPMLLLYCIIFFAISTTLCWYYYGRIAWGYLFDKLGVILYSFSYFISFFIAITTQIPHVLFITDTALFFLSIISLSALIKNRALLRFDENTLDINYSFENINS